MKKPGKRETVNLFFSAFLILAFIVCAHFFSQFAASLTGANGNLSAIGRLVTCLIYIVFGLLVFYATRVGDGKAVKRFSPLTLIIVVVPAILVVIASMISFDPFNSGSSVFVTDKGGVSIVTALASVALGYGIPYTFLSGFELKSDDEAEEEENAEPLEGGVEADIIEAQEEAAAEAVEETEETAQEAVEEAADTVEAE